MLAFFGVVLHFGDCVRSKLASAVLVVPDLVKTMKIWKRLHMTTAAVASDCLMIAVIMRCQCIALKPHVATTMALHLP